MNTIERNFKYLVQKKFNYYRYLHDADGTRVFLSTGINK